VRQTKHQSKNEKVILLLTLSMGLSFATYATSNPKPTNPAKAKEVPVVVFDKDSKQDVTAPQAYHCVIYKDGVKVAECWLCNCENLYKAVHGSTKA
jgi:hypothetical protein